MPKTHKNLYQRLCSFQYLHNSWLAAKRHKRYQHAILDFEYDLEANLLDLVADLKGATYRVSGYRYFYVYEPKKRQVACLTSFRDRVIQHAVCSLLEPIFDPMFIATSFACRKGKGTHAGVASAEQMMRAVKCSHGKVFALKCDIRKYFENINHATLLSLIARKITDKKMLDLLSEIIGSFRADGCGLPLGNLTSQLFANIYLHALDSYLKHELAVEYYVRYMDDFVIFHHDKQHLHQLRKNIEDWLSENLHLELNAKTAVFPISSQQGRPLDFLGYRILPNRRLLRRNAIKKITKKLGRLHKAYAGGEIEFRDVKLQLASHMAHAKHADTGRLLRRILAKPFVKSI